MTRIRRMHDQLQLQTALWGCATKDSTWRTLKGFCPCIRPIRLVQLGPSLVPYPCGSSSFRNGAYPHSGLVSVIQCNRHRMLNP